MSCVPRVRHRVARPDPGGLTRPPRLLLYASNPISSKNFSTDLQSHD